MEGGHRFQRGQVIGMSGAIGFGARGIEDVHGVAQPDLDPDGLEGRRRRTVAGPGNGLEVVGVDLEFRHVAAREATGQPSYVVDRSGGSAGEHVHHLGGDASGGAADRLMDVLPSDAARV